MKKACLKTLSTKCVYTLYIFVIYVWRGLGGAHGVMVIIIGNGHGDTSSNPGWNWWHFT